MVGSSPGGRLSTTNQPRSSSDLAAVDRPAPDRPVMTTMSAGSSAVLIVFPHVVRAKGSRNGGGQPGSDTRHRRDLLDARRAELAHRAKLLEQRLAARPAQPPHTPPRPPRCGPSPLRPP